MNSSTVENGERKEKKPIILETDEEKRDRMWSLRIIYFTMFLISLGFSIVLTGIWPYLDKVCRTFWGFLIKFGYELINI